MSKKYNKIFVVNDSKSTLYIGNLKELYRGLLLVEDSFNTRYYKVDFGNAPDYINIAQCEKKERLESGLYSVSNSSKIEDIRKRAFGLADHINLKHYIFVCNYIYIDIITHKPITILLKQREVEVERWSIG